MGLTYFFHYFLLNDMCVKKKRTDNCPLSKNFFFFLSFQKNSVITGLYPSILKALSFCLKRLDQINDT